jgi:hypothetical protein
MPGPWDNLSEATCKYWAIVLRRAKEEASADAHLQLCADAVDFAMSHLRLPLGGLLAEAFPTVYEAVSSSNEPPESGWFRFFNWDRAKELRKALIDAFFNSDWRPGDLAIAAGGETLLRKLFKRIRRRWRGEQYIAAMIEDLGQREESRAAKAHETLLRLSSDPEFYEPWD